MTSNLVAGSTKSCGCLRREFADTKRTHGRYGHALYCTYRQILARCTDPNHHAYARYGGRGIRLADEWAEIGAFIDGVEAEIGPRPEGMTIDRVDNDGDYRPGNIRWATPAQQMRNRKNNRWLVVDGRRQCLADWAQETNTNPVTIASRIKRGWSMRDSVYGRG